MIKNKILLVLVLDIALLLLPLSFLRGEEMDAIVSLVIDDPDSAKPFMTGVRLSSWDGPRQLYVLQIESLAETWKTLGPFQLDDQRDISASNCSLRSDSASLAGNLQEIKKLLVPMLKSLENPKPQPLSASPPKLEAESVTHKEKLVGLPPALKARPFACAISQPQGRETIFRADLATFSPTQSDILLEGNVTVTGGNLTRLTAEHILWKVIPQELNVEGTYCFQTGEREIRGQDACFSLSGGGMEPIKFATTQTLPYPGELSSPASIGPFMVSPRGKGSPLRKKTILSILSKTALQMINAAVVPMDQRLTSVMNQGKEASFPYPKQNVFPSPPKTDSLEKIYDRELFCEKSR